MTTTTYLVLILSQELYKGLYILFLLSFNELSRYGLLCLLYLEGNRSLPKVTQEVGGRTTAQMGYD